MISMTSNEFNRNPFRRKKVIPFSTVSHHTKWTIAQILHDKSKGIDRECQIGISLVETTLHAQNDLCLKEKEEENRNVGSFLL